MLRSSPDSETKARATYFCWINILRVFLEMGRERADMITSVVFNELVTKNYKH